MIAIQNKCFHLQAKGNIIIFLQLYANCTSMDNNLWFGKKEFQVTCFKLCCKNVFILFTVLRENGIKGGMLA